MSANPNYQIFKIDLTTAGQQDIPAMFTYFRLIRAVGASGVVSLDAIVYVQPRRTGGDEIPMQLNGLVQLPAGTDFVRVRWDAQPGVIVSLFMSDQDRNQGIDVEAPPTKQIVTTSIGSIITDSAVTVGLAAGLIVAASSRQSVLITNNGTAKIFIGAGTVTLASGTPLDIGQSISIDKTTAAIYGISGTAGQDVRVLVEA